MSHFFEVHPWTIPAFSLLAGAAVGAVIFFVMSWFEMRSEIRRLTSNRDEWRELAEGLVFRQHAAFPPPEPNIPVEFTQQPELPF